MHRVHKKNYKIHRVHKMNYLSHDYAPVDPLSVDNTILRVAIREKDFEKVKKMLDFGYRPLPSWSDGEFAVESDICLSVDYGELDIFRILCLQKRHNVQETVLKILDCNNVIFMKELSEVLNLDTHVLKHVSHFQDKSSNYFIERLEILKFLHSKNVSISFLYRYVVNSVNAFGIITRAGGNPHESLSVFGDSIYDMVDKHFYFFLLFTVNNDNPDDRVTLRKSYLRALDKYIFWDSLVLYNYRREHFNVSKDSFGELVKRIADLDNCVIRNIRDFL